MSEPADRPPLGSDAPSGARDGMRCPGCGADRTWSVCYTRYQPGAIRRVRICRRCGRRVVTLERIAGAPGS